jgi:hypothetical protein
MLLLTAIITGTLSIYLLWIWRDMGKEVSHRRIETNLTTGLPRYSRYSENYPIPRPPRTDDPES